LPAKGKRSLPAKVALAGFQRLLSNGIGNVSGILPGGLSRPFAGKARSHNEAPAVFQALILR
tara:strand:- start:445 stop:630 length:186 start_codon:yes stop_codon:yes gene_type:complete